MAFFERSLANVLDDFNGLGCLWLKDEAVPPVLYIRNAPFHTAGELINVIVIRHQIVPLPVAPLDIEDESVLVLVGRAAVQPRLMRQRVTSVVRRYSTAARDRGLTADDGGTWCDFTPGRQP